METEAYK